MCVCSGYGRGGDGWGGVRLGGGDCESGGLAWMLRTALIRPDGAEKKPLRSLTDRI